MFVLKVFILLSCLGGWIEAKTKIKTESPPAGCFVQYPTLSTAFSPLVLHPTTGALLTPGADNKIQIAQGEFVTFSCKQHEIIPPAPDNKLSAKCNAGTLTLQGELHDINVDFDDIACKTRVIELYATSSPKCSDRLIVYHFYDKGQTSSTVVAETCFNSELQTPIYSHFKVSKTPQFLKSPPTITKSDFVSTIEILSTYRSDKLNQKLTSLLGQNHVAKDNRLISVSLIPKELLHKQLIDVSKRAHNIVAIFDAVWVGNFAHFVNDVKKLTTKDDRVFDIYSGPYEVLKLSDNKQFKTKVYLQSNTNTNKKTYPLPLYVWFVVSEEKTQKAVAIIIETNPFVRAKNEYEELEFCTNICSQISWLNELKQNGGFPQQGHTFCCALDTFRSKVNNIQVIKDITVKSGTDGLLTV